MRRIVSLLLCAGAALAGAQAPAHAQNACVTAGVEGVVNEEVGPVCVATPFPVHCRSSESSVRPYAVAHLTACTP